jgi:hypothetical protein
MAAKKGKAVVRGPLTDCTVAGPITTEPAAAHRPTDACGQIVVAPRTDFGQEFKHVVSAIPNALGDEALLLVHEMNHQWHGGID